MAARFGVFCIAYVLGSLLTADIPPELIVWNVGQGQWVTMVDGQGCWHIDMGGEFAPWKKIRETCRARDNRISLSHWDTDHIGFAGKARSQLPNLCLINAPVGRASPHKEALIYSLPRCAGHSPFTQWSDLSGKTANDKSWVVLWHRVLLPGDSTRTEEKKWMHHMPGLEAARIFVLGHHGSRTSTSQELLNSLKNIRVAIASARFRRYGHPHAEVVRELFRAHVPLLRTEEWGTIHMRLD
jgi:competence protein ComEC